jgi:hypothetical protein
MKTVRVRMLESVSSIGDEFNGVEGLFSLGANQEVDLPSDLAAKWVASGRCVVIATPEPVLEVPLAPASGKSTKK